MIFILCCFEVALRREIHAEAPPSTFAVYGRPLMIRAVTVVAIDTAGDENVPLLLFLAVFFLFAFRYDCRFLHGRIVGSARVFSL